MAKIHQPETAKLFWCIQRISYNSIDIKNYHMPIEVLFFKLFSKKEKFIKHKYSPPSWDNKIIKRKRHIHRIMKGLIDSLNKYVNEQNLLQFVEIFQKTLLSSVLCFTAVQSLEAVGIFLQTATLISNQRYVWDGHGQAGRRADH